MLATACSFSFGVSLNLLLAASCWAGKVCKGVKALVGRRLSVANALSTCALCRASIGIAGHYAYPLRVFSKVRQIVRGARDPTAISPIRPSGPIVVVDHEYVGVSQVQQAACSRRRFKKWPEEDICCLAAPCCLLFPRPLFQIDKYMTRSVTGSYR